MKDLLKNVQPSIYEFIFMSVIAVLFLVAFTMIDMGLHDGYIRPIVAECYESNLSEFCEERRFELLGTQESMSFLPDIFLAEQDDQLRLGGVYWMTLLSIVIFFSIIIGVLRIVTGRLAGAEINPMLFLIGLLWGISIIVLYYFGWLDYLYFALRGLNIPTDLAWLNGVGIFKYVQGFGVNENVNDTDLYILMSIGLVTFIGIWAGMIHHIKKGTLERFGLVSDD